MTADYWDFESLAGLISKGKTDVLEKKSKVKSQNHKSILKTLKGK